jgi:hypothetical protein
MSERTKATRASAHASRHEDVALAIFEARNAPVVEEDPGMPHQHNQTLYAVQDALSKVFAAEDPFFDRSGFIATCELGVPYSVNASPSCCACGGDPKAKCHEQDDDGTCPECGSSNPATCGCLCLECGEALNDEGACDDCTREAKG